VDDRYRSHRYKSLFPVNWKPVMVSTGKELEQALDKFWIG
jgi:hypothetical protein